MKKLLLAKRLNLYLHFDNLLELGVYWQANDISLVQALYDLGLIGEEDKNLTEPEYLAKIGMRDAEFSFIPIYPSKTEMQNWTVRAVHVYGLDEGTIRMMDKITAEHEFIPEPTSAAQKRKWAAYFSWLRDLPQPRLRCIADMSKEELLEIKTDNPKLRAIIDDELRFFHN